MVKIIRFITNTEREAKLNIKNRCGYHLDNTAVALSVKVFIISRELIDMTVAAMKMQAESRGPASLGQRPQASPLQGTGHPLSPPQVASPSYLTPPPAGSCLSLLLSS